MKRDSQCSACGGSGRHPELIAKHDALVVDGVEVHPAYEGPAQCDACAGTGKVGVGNRALTLKVPHDHPNAAKIKALLAEGGDQ